MADEIKQPRNIGSVQPANPSRGAAQRKRPRQAPARRDGDDKERRPDEDPPHRVDEYV